MMIRLWNEYSKLWHDQRSPLFYFYIFMFCIRFLSFFFSLPIARYVAELPRNTILRHYNGQIISLTRNHLIFSIDQGQVSKDCLLGLKIIFYWSCPILDEIEYLFATQFWGWTKNLFKHENTNTPFK